MGLTQSSGIPEGGTEGYHVHGVQEDSPAEKAGLEPFFDFIISIDNSRLNQENEMLKNLLKANVEKPVKMEVYSTKTMRMRELEVVPSNMWGGQGLLGASVRFCSFQGANENVWHVLDVEPNSPAALAGLQEHSDFIVGADQVLQDSEDFFSLIEAHEGKPLKLLVYSAEIDKCREVVVTPNGAWGGEGSLGCGIGYGYLHRIPAPSDVPKPEQVSSEVSPVPETPGQDYPTNGYTEVSLMASGQSASGKNFETPLPPPIQRVMDPGILEQSEAAVMNSEVSDTAEHLDLSVSSIDMTNTSLAVREDLDVSGVEELQDREDQITAMESTSSDVSPPFSLQFPLLPNLPFESSVAADMASLMNSSQIPSLDSSMPPIDISSLLIDPVELQVESSSFLDDSPVLPTESSGYVSEALGFPEELQTLENTNQFEEQTAEGDAAPQ
ncbi:hypothetical protein DNTS_002802 [Danionella cerebrum]|uniref:PDZ GRASP-type domain-containing protein n=1 Tax=Danionella cerebrum TaxID=2873325 RepID=A0A553MKZ9_9TELE|nr:hypothetical protein DNTS_002802 [Danionella translucida]TRY53851.1 hypothetical protein DNTS_002802 [Danionella translucida]